MACFRIGHLVGLPTALQLWSRNVDLVSTVSVHHAQTFEHDQTPSSPVGGCSGTVVLYSIEPFTTYSQLPKVAHRKSLQGLLDVWPRTHNVARL